MNLGTVRGWFATGSQFRMVLLLVVTTLVAAFFLTDLNFTSIPEYQERDVPDRDVIASNTFSFVDEEATRTQQANAQHTVPPVFILDRSVVRTIESQVSQAFDMARSRYATAADNRGKVPPEVSERISHDFAESLGIGLEAADRQLLTEDAYSSQVEDLVTELVAVAMRHPVLEDRSSLPSSGPIVVISTEGGLREETLVDDFSRLRTVEDAWQAIGLYVVERLSAVQSPARVKVAAALAKGLLKPNFTVDTAETLRRQALARDAVHPVEVEIRKGKRIVRVGDPVTAVQARELAALRANSQQSGSGWMFLTHIALVGVVLASTTHFARTTVRKFAPRPQDLEAMAFTLVLVLAMARGLAQAGSILATFGTLDPGLTALLVPVAGGTMLIRVLVNSESALGFSLAASVLSAMIMDRSALLVAWYLVTSTVAAGAVGQGRERVTVLRAGLQASLIGLGLTVVTMLARQHGPGADMVALTWARLVWVGGAALVAGLFNAILALGLVPIFELSGFITDYKLLELSNLNHPLLRQLMLRAPGTYHHSVIVGSLSEAACEAIGANALLARVACYFHDIGKGVKPQYFVENQRDGNRHDRLSPVQSAQVIINHVRDGHLLALQYKLPKSILDNVFMHHGTGIIQYFYNKAKEQSNGEPVDPALFRYPGPKPDSREAGIIMLADKVEAACRTIKDPQEPRIRAMIQQIINSVMMDGQFENCPLTLKELYQIADSFTMVLLGIYHHRIEYPDTRAISSGKGKFIPVPRQGTITLEIMNPLTSPPPPGSASTVGSPPARDPTNAEDYERLEALPGSSHITLPPDDS